MTMAKVYVGIGHGGSDNGATANGFKEDDLNLAIGQACADELKRHGVNVMISRASDVAETVNQKIAECNKFNPDYCLDIHNNSGGGDGAEVFHHHGGGKSKTLAQNILDSVVAIGQQSRGIKTKLNSSGQDYYGFIRDTKAPAVIVECAFVDNKKDLQIIDTKAEQQSMGKAIAKGVLKTLGIAYKKEETKVATKKDNTPAEWAKDAVNWAVKEGLLKGDENGNYKLHENITVERFLVFLYRYDQSK